MDRHVETHTSVPRAHGNWLISLPYCLFEAGVLVRTSQGCRNQGQQSFCGFCILKPRRVSVFVRVCPCRDIVQKGWWIFPDTGPPLRQHFSYMLYPVSLSCSESSVLLHWRRSLVVWVSAYGVGVGVGGKHSSSSYPRPVTLQDITFAGDPRKNFIARESRCSPNAGGFVWLRTRMCGSSRGSCFLP